MKFSKQRIIVMCEFDRQKIALFFEATPFFWKIDCNLVIKIKHLQLQKLNYGIGVIINWNLRHIP